MATSPDGGVRAYLYGAGAGAVAYLLGYVVVFLLVGGQVRESLTGQLLDATDEGAWKAVGWVFYNAHLVATETRIDVLGGLSSSTNFIMEGAFSPALYLVPAVLLFAGGIAVARAGGIAETGRAAGAGAATAVGYLPLAAVGAFLFAVSGPFGRVGPPLVTAVLVAGLVYPVVLGALGAAAATRL